MGPQHSDQLHEFTEVELTRLAAYRNAVTAGFYTDACDTAAPSGDRDLSLQGLIGGRVEGYSFSHRELQRIATYKLAVAIGLYTDALKGG